MVERCPWHPPFRAMRPGRLVNTALEASLPLYREGDEISVDRVPALRSALAVWQREKTLTSGLADLPGLNVAVVESGARAGSASLPALPIPGWAVRVNPQHSLLSRLRAGEPPNVGRLDSLLDPRGLDGDDLELPSHRFARPLAVDGVGRLEWST